VDESSITPNPLQDWFTHQSNSDLMLDGLPSNWTARFNSALGIPAKANAHSGGNPNGIPG
jgi:hypothetical protein